MKADGGPHMQSDSSTRKTCTVCREIKPLSSFGYNRRQADGLNYECKVCACARSRRFRETHPERWKTIARTAQTRWKKNNPDHYKSPIEREKAALRSKRWYQSPEGRRKRQTYDSLEEVKAARARWAEENREHLRLQKRRSVCRKYGITIEQYEDLLTSQNAVCAICGQAETVANVSGTGWALSIDHDHNCCPQARRSCGKCVRGLLCDRCNRAIGAFSDSIPLIKNALEYLSRGKQHDAD